MKRDFHKDLESAARQMILIHRVDTLIRLILRTIMKNIAVEHTGIFLYKKEKDAYVVKVSRGRKESKIPADFAKVKKNNPIVRYFLEYRRGEVDNNFLLYNQLDYYINQARRDGRLQNVRFFTELKDELETLGAYACIPGFFRNNLVGILFLGAKKNNKDFTAEELGFLSVLASDVVMALRNAQLFEDLERELNRNKKLFLNTVTAMAAAIEAKDSYTLGHTERVVKYSLQIVDNLAKEKEGISYRFRENVRISALLHDIGKIGVAEAVLNKKGRLDSQEWKMICQHPSIGASILEPIAEFQEVIVGVKYHHERYDGKGYPEGLAGDKIPFIASIIAVADSFDAMTSNRPYRKALSKQQALDEIRNNVGKQFNPVAGNIFLKINKY
jgi:HD-GYP domain-containing protein (c-di-GMP phosphodiesterase class II)